MARSKREKKNLKRKKKKKQVKASRIRSQAAQKGWYHFEDAHFYYLEQDMPKAVKYIKKAVKALPNEPDVLMLMASIAREINNSAMELKAVLMLDKTGQIPPELKFEIPSLLYMVGRFEDCIKYIDTLIAIVPTLKMSHKREAKKEVKKIRQYCEKMIAIEGQQKKAAEKIPSDTRSDKEKKTNKPVEKIRTSTKTSTVTSKAASESVKATPGDIPDISTTCTIDKKLFLKALSNLVPAGPATHELAVLSHEIQLAESFETLISLSSLKGIQSFNYQEETAKKVLKQFRGRALLSDEVGLGKTIEALMVLKEYIQRAMVQSFLILTPTPLVSQWQQEMKSKFNIDACSTDDKGFCSGVKSFWDKPFVVASINQAKSRKNEGFIIKREYDMVIVDEAHHLKNRSTLNWKLVNSLKKRFILLLTATPVENNLMELYNLITLLKPGQLETATSFRKKFMTKGDPTDPKNRALLKGLLNQVMIRNTRALANINIPPRFAETIRIKPDEREKAFYEKLEDLIFSLDQKKQGRIKMVVKNLLAQAGSSPRAVELTLQNMLEKENYTREHQKELKAVAGLCRAALDTPKNKMLLKLIKASKEKIIVFVKYKGTIEHLEEFLEWNNISFVLFHGSMGNKQKDAAIDQFRDTTKVLVTTEIGGEGRNLQFCSRMVNYDLPWNPMKIEQRIGRIHRIGQEKEVHIYNFCASGSIEDYILDILDRKINMFEMVIGEIDMILGRIRGEKEFGDIVYDIWLESRSKTERKKFFSALGTKLKRAKTGYNKTRDLDDKLFGDTYEL